MNPVTSLPEVNPGDVSAAASLLGKVSPEVNVDSSSDEEVLLLGQPQLLYLPSATAPGLLDRWKKQAKEA